MKIVFGEDDITCFEIKIKIAVEMSASVKYNLNISIKIELHCNSIFFGHICGLYLAHTTELINRPGVARAVLQLDGVGPVDNRPSTN